MLCLVHTYIDPSVCRLIASGSSREKKKKFVRESWTNCGSFCEHSWGNSDMYIWGHILHRNSLDFRGNFRRSSVGYPETWAAKFAVSRCEGGIRGATLAGRAVSPYPYR